MPTYDWTRKLLKAWRLKRTRRKQRFSTDSLVPQLSIKRLEERLVLNADAAPVEVLVVNAGDAGGDGQADIYQVQQEADYIQVSVNGQELHRAPVGSLSAIHINGSADNDVLVADLLAGVDLVFDGGGGDDTLSIHGGEYDQVTYEFGDGSAGQVEAQSSLGIAKIDFQGVEKIADSLTAADREFSFQGAERHLTLGNPANAQDSSRLTIAAVNTNTENDISVDFLNPTESLTVDTNHGDSGGNSDRADRVEVTGLGDGFDADFHVTGSANDHFLLNGDIDLGSRDFTVSTGSIVLNGGIFSDNAEVELNAHTAIEINEEATIENDGGQVRLAAPEITMSGTISAAAGFVELDSGDHGVTLVKGVIDVSDPSAGGQGGVVHLLGGSVGVMEGAQLSAAGNNGGGTILIGGGYQGSESAVRNANYTYVGATALLNADSMVHGTGGKIIVWANEATRFYGHASARGGELGGDGGFVEVSGKQGLDYRGTADLRAAAGEWGTLLLDPTNINISNLASVNVSLISPFIPLAAGASNLLIATLQAALLLGDVTVQTANFGAANGDLSLLNNIDINGLGILRTLSFIAHGNIDINGTISDSNTLTVDRLNIVLVANSDNVGGGNVDIDAAITTHGGSFTSSGVNFDSTGFSISTGGGDVSIDHTGLVTLPGNLATDGINSGDGDVTIIADNMTLTPGAAVGQAIDAGTGSVNLQTSTLNRPINLGSLDAAALSIVVAELNEIVAETLRVGSSTAGEITVTAALTPTTFNNLALISGDTIAIDQAIDLGADDLELDAAVSVTQAAAGTITAGGLALQGAGSVTLNNAANNVATIAGNSGGTISYTDADSLTVGTVGGITGITTTGDDVRLVVGNAVGEDLAIDETVNLGLGDLLLDVAGNVTQAAAITAAGLALQVDGTTTLELATNNVTTLAASTGGTISYTDADSLAVGTVTVLALPALTGITTTGNDVLLTVGNAVGENLAINGAVALGIGNLLLDVAGNVTQTAAITATGLALLVDGNTTLELATNNVTTIAASTGGTISYTDADSLTVGTVTVLAQPALTGITTTGDDVRLVVGNVAGENLVINEVITLGAGDLLLDVAGNVTQAAAITATGLALLVDGTTILELATNNVTALAASTGGTISYTDADSLNVGTVTVLAQPALTGITTTNDDVRLVVGDIAGENLAINGAVALGSGGLLLDVAGNVTQTAAITAAGLALLVVGNTTLETTTNNVATLAALTGGTISYTDADSLTVGTVTVLAQPAITGITTTDDDVRLVVGDAVGENLAIDEAVALGLGDLLLDVAGNVTQTATITAEGLALLVDGATTLNLATNNVATIAASSGGTISYTDADSLTIGTVTVLAQPAITGITTTGDDVRLVVGDAVGENLAINGAVALGAGDLLLDVAGDVTQTAAITGAGLALLVDDTTTLELATNNVATIAASTGGIISYTDADSLSVGAVTVLAQPVLTGITTTNDDVRLTVGNAAGENLAINGAVSVGIADLLLDVAGDVTQTAAITATGLALLVDGNTTLELPTNSVATIAANTGGSISYTDANDLTVGTVTVLDGLANEATLTGITTTNDDVTLLLIAAAAVLTVPDSLGVDGINTAGGNVTLIADNMTFGTAAAAFAVNAGTGIITVQANSNLRTVSLGLEDGTALSLTDAELDELVATTLRVGSTSGADINVTAAISPANVTNLVFRSNANVSQTVGSTITVTGLGLDVTLSTTLGDNNDVDILAANNDGTIFFFDIDGLTVGTVDTLIGINTSGDDVRLVVGDAVGEDLAIDGAIALGAGDLLLDVAGNVTQTAAITGAGLALLVDGATTLELATNNITTLAASTEGTISYADADSLTVATVTVLGQPTVTGITTSDDDVRLVVGNAVGENLAINGAVALGAGDLLLDVAGNVTQTAAVTVTDLALLVDGSTTLDLTTNNVSTLAASSGGAISYADADSLTIGTVMVLTQPAVTGITTTGDDVRLVVGNMVGHDLAINEAVALGAGGLLLDVAGNVGQAAAGAVTSAGLALLVDGDTTLLNNTNNVTTLAASTEGIINYVDANSLEVGSVTVLTQPAIVGITTTGDDVRLVVGDAAGENLAINGAVGLGAGNLLLDVADSVTQTASVTATGLALLVDGNATLALATNNVTTLAGTIGGAISYTDFDSLIVDTVTVLAQPAVIGVTAFADVALTTALNLDAISLIQSTTGSVDLEAGNFVTLDAAVNALLGNIGVAAGNAIDSIRIGNTGILNASGGSITAQTLAITVTTAGPRFSAADNSNDQSPQPITFGSDATIQFVFDETSPGAVFEVQIDWRESNNFVGGGGAFPGGVLPVNDPNLLARIVRSVLNNAPLEALFIHTYFANPDGVESSVIYVPIRISQIAGDTINLTLGGTDILEFDQGAGSLTDTDGNPIVLSGGFDRQVGIMAVISIGVLPGDIGGVLPLPEALPADAPALPAVLNSAPTPLLTSINAVPFEQSSASATSQPEERYYQLRIFSFDETTHEFVESSEERIDLSSESFEAIAPFDPSKLPELFKRLPGDRYRIYLIEDGTERLMIEFVIEQVGDEGHPVELPETSDTQGRAPANLDDTNLQEQPADPSAAHPVVKPASGDGEDSSFAERLGRASFVSTGGVLFGSAMLSKSVKQSRETQADRRMAAFRKKMRTKSREKMTTSSPDTF